MTLKEEIQHLLNKCCAENASNTPDWILAEYLYDCLKAFEKASNAREKWYDVKLEPGQDRSSWMNKTASPEHPTAEQILDEMRLSAKKKAEGTVPCDRPHDDEKPYKQQIDNGT